MSDELSDEFPPELRPPACTHSVLDPTCASCWYGAARRVAKERNDLMNLRLLKVLENELLADAHQESARLAAHNGLLIEERDAEVAKRREAERERDEARTALFTCRRAMRSTLGSLTETARREVHMYLSEELCDAPAAAEWHESVIAAEALDREGEDG